MTTHADKFAELQAAHDEMRRRYWTAQAGFDLLTVRIGNSAEFFEAQPEALHLADAIARMGKRQNVRLDFPDAATIKDFGGSMALRSMTLAQRTDLRA